MYVDNIYYYIFNSTKQIKEICSEFDFSLYTNSLEENNIDCFNEKNLLYYSKENIDTSFSEGLTLPECVCLPLYCIKNLDNNICINSPCIALTANAISGVKKMYLSEGFDDYLSKPVNPA